MPVDSAAYRNAISRFLTGVTIVTTVADDKPSGLTATAIASVTLEPPTLLACLNRHSSTCQAIIQAGRFTVNVLANDQTDMAKLFASEAGVENSLEAMRIFGGYSYSTDFDVERYYRDAPLMCIGEGTNEMQRIIIARQLIERNPL